MKFFITGISRGLGLTLAKECISRGHEVWGIARTEIPDIGISVHYRKCDISDLGESEKIYREMIGSGYIPDIVILNAAVIKDDLSSGMNIDMKVVRETFNVNCTGNISWISFFLPHLIPKKEGGTFINVSSVSSFRAVVRKKIGYPASKSAMDMIFESLRINFGDKKIRFVTVNLGPIAETMKIPLISKTYGEVANKIIDIAENHKKNGAISYSVFAGLLYRVFRFLPDSLIRRILGYDYDMG